MRQKITSVSASETEHIGRVIGGQLRGDEIVLLKGDVGAGKTTFVRGLVSGLGAKDHVSSPTFTIAHEYLSGRLPVRHYDLYRLGELGLLDAELHEAVELKDSVIVIEWPDLAVDNVPQDRLLLVTFRKEKASEDMRLMEFEYPEGKTYLKVTPPESNA